MLLDRSVDHKTKHIITWSGINLWLFISIRDAFFSGVHIRLNIFSHAFFFFKYLIQIEPYQIDQLLNIIKMEEKLVTKEIHIISDLES